MHSPSQKVPYFCFCTVRTEKKTLCPAPRTSSETPLSCVAGGIKPPTLPAQPWPKRRGRVAPRAQRGSWLGLGERRPVASQLLLLCCPGFTALVGGTDAEAEAPTLWPPDEKANSLEKVLLLGKTEGRRRRGQQRTGWLHGITDSMHMSLSQLLETVKDREAWHMQSVGLQRVRQTEGQQHVAKCPLHDPSRWGWLCWPSGMSGICAD